MQRLLQELDALEPDERGRVFEHRVVPWILRESPVYRDVLASVWQWNDYHQRHRWGPDLGIDLIAEERTGRLWAVQAKAHAADHDVTWADISTFVGAAAARPEVGCLVLITTAQSVGRRAQRQLQASGKSTIILDRERLEDLGLPDDVLLADLAKPIIAMPRLKPRPHQSEAIAATVQGFRSSARGQVIHACGTGKTLTALWTKEALDAQRTIMFCPSLGLVDQTLRSWQAQKSSPFTAVVVCSDQSIGGPDGDGEGAASLELAVPPTTDARRLRSALEGQSGAVVVFATYQSSAVIAEALRGSAFRFDLLVADEAHRTTGLSGGDFHRPLDDTQIGADRRLFFTATPRIYRPRRVPDAEGDAVDVVSMDNATQYGPCFHRLSFREAIERDLLSDYRVVIFGVTPGEVADLIALRAFVTHDGTDVTEAPELATHVALARAMREFGMRRTISFHSRVKSAGVFANRFSRVAEWLPTAQRPEAPVWTAMLSGEDSVHRRRQILRRLREGTGGEYGLVTNARCLSEGIDVPAIDGIVFVDPKSSEIDIVQAVGRAIRKSEDKSGVATIVLPLVIPDDASEATSALEGSAYAYIWRVIDALRSHDEGLGEDLDALRRSNVLEKGQTGSLPPKIILRLPSRVSTTFPQALSLRILERTTSSWEEGYAQLMVYREREGHSWIPATHRQDDGFRLGTWVTNQRQADRAGKLLADRRARLDTLGFVWDPLDEQWEDGYAHLLAYHTRHGHAWVQRTHVTDDGLNLGTWVGTQRASAGTLSPDRRTRLDALGFIWDLYADQWEEGHAHLVAYHKREGHSRVPPEHREHDGFQVGAWLTRQRQVDRAGELSPERRARLDALGFIWDPNADRWEEGYAQLVAYHEREGHSRVPPGHHEGDGFHLGAWMTRQRQVDRAGKLLPERRARLETLGIIWDPFSDQWEEGYAHLVAYHARHGHAGAPNGYVADDGFVLGTWVANQRTTDRAGRLFAERRARLETLGFSWDPNTDQWEEGYAHLVAYYTRHGHSGAPNGYVAEDGFELGTWVAHQRHPDREGGLPAERRARLETLGFSWDPNADQWEEGYVHLVAYHDREGHCWVPASHNEDDGLQLGRWVHTQRLADRAGKLSAERRARLETLGFIWDPYADRWGEGYAHLMAYHIRHGHAEVPNRYLAEDGFKLGMWAANQRKAGNAGAILAERRARLDALEFIWDPYANQWEEGYAHLVAYHARHGHAEVPKRNVADDGFKLGSWITNQRTAGGAGAISAERRVRLDALGFIWDQYADQWEEGYAHLAAYHAKYRHAGVPQAYIANDGFKLGSWVSNQRTKARTGTLSAERRARLEQLSGWSRRQSREPRKGRQETS